MEWPEDETPIHRLVINSDSTFSYTMTFCYPYFSGKGRWSVIGDSIQFRFLGAKSSVNRKFIKGAKSIWKNRIEIRTITPPLGEDEYITLNYLLDGESIEEDITVIKEVIMIDSTVEQVFLYRKKYDMIEVHGLSIAEEWSLNFIKIDFGFKRMQGLWSENIKIDPVTNNVNIGAYIKE